MIKLALMAMLLFVSPARSSGNVIAVTSSGLTVVKAAAAVIARAVSYAFTVLGHGWSPPAGNGNFVVPIGVNGNTDAAVVASAAVSPDADPAPLTPATCDQFGYCGKKAPTSGGYSNHTYTLYHDPDQGCGLPSVGVKTFYGTGCAGKGVTGATREEIYVVTGQWWHPHCTCLGACVPDSAGCPYTTGGSQCTVYGTGEDLQSVHEYTYCADPQQTAESTSIALNTQNVDPHFQPPDIAPADTNTTAAARSSIVDAMSAIEANVAAPIRNSVDNPIGVTYAALVAGKSAIDSPVQLTIGQFTYPVGSPALSGGACSTCTASSPSSSAVQNVWVMNGQQHVWIDNPQSGSSVTVNVSSVVTLGDSDALVGISSYTVPSDTETLASVYADFLATRATNALVGMIANLGVAVSSGSASFDTNLCFPTPARFGGPHCVDIDASGKWSALVFILRWSVIASAIVAAYFIIYG